MIVENDKSTLSIERSDIDNIRSINIGGSLDAFTADNLESEISGGVQKGIYNFLIGFQELDYISSAGLGVFMTHIEEIRENGGDIKLYGMNDKIFRIFDLLGFPLIFDIKDTKEDSFKLFEV
jgi:anti-sigma B factor antagonist